MMSAFTKLFLGIMSAAHALFGVIALFFWYGGASPFDGGGLLAFAASGGVFLGAFAVIVPFPIFTGIFSGGTATLSASVLAPFTALGMILIGVVGVYATLTMTRSEHGIHLLSVVAAWMALIIFYNLQTLPRPLVENVLVIFFDIVKLFLFLIFVFILYKNQRARTGIVPSAMSSAVGLRNEIHS